jgi:hypothetical protein
MFYHTSIIPKCHQSSILYDQHNEGNESLQSEEEAYGIEREKKKGEKLILTNGARGWMAMTKLVQI